MQVNKEFLFGCSTGVFGRGFGSRKGIIEGHAYSVQRVVEIEGKRLILLRNPWGRGEWKGAWADGSKEWSPEWMKKLGHKFGEDGEFWICYEDLLRHYQCFERVRLFGPDWNVSQIWTTLHVPWVQEYNETHFSFTTTQSGPVVIVVSQLDDRYFRGLEGQYMFQLSFRVHKAGNAGYIVRSETAHRMRRSANVELELEAGAYEVYVKIKAWRDDDLLPVQATIRKWAKTKRDKVSRIGRAYDLAHSRGQIIESKEEKEAREAYEKKKMQKKREVAKRNLQKESRDAWYQKKKDQERSRARAAKRKEKKKAKKAEKAKAKAERKAAKAAEKKAKADEAADQKEASRTTGTEPAEKKEKVEDGKVEVAKKEAEIKREVETKNETKGDSKEQPKAELREKSKGKSKNKAEGKEPESQKNKKKEDESEESDSDSDDSDSDSDDSDSDSDDESVAFTDYSDGELEIQVDVAQRDDPTLLDSSSEEEDSDEENGLFAKDPWNAVAVVGLRVYHKAAAAPGATVTLGVVRPNPYVDASSSDGEGTTAAGTTDGGKGKASVLDVDDSAMDATLEGEVKDKKEVIMGVKGTPA